MAQVHLNRPEALLKSMLFGVRERMKHVFKSGLSSEATCR